VANVWRFTVEGKLYNGDLWEWNLHYQTDVPLAGSEPSAETVLTQLAQHYSSTGENLQKISVLMASNCTIDRLRVFQRVATWDGEVPEATVRDYAIAGAASVGSDVLPPALCPWIKCTTAKAGRSFRGGFHLCNPVNVDLLDGTGRWQTGTTWKTNADALAVLVYDVLEDVFSTTGDIIPVIYSETRHRAGLDQTEKITNAQLSLSPRWLRRRMEHHGV